jgi:hypothetical protein
MKILNIYGQLDNHAEARIIGNSEGLKELITTLQRALDKGKSTTEDDVKDGNTALFASDGEGYEVIVECHDDKWVTVADGLKMVSASGVFNEANLKGILLQVL